MEPAVEELLSNIDWKNAIEVKCVKCECPIFKPAYGIRRVSSLASPNGKELIIPIRIFACDKCGHVDENLQVNMGE